MESVVKRLFGNISSEVASSAGEKERKKERKKEGSNADSGTRRNYAVYSTCVEIKEDSLLDRFSKKNQEDENSVAHR